MQAADASNQRTGSDAGRTIYVLQPFCLKLVDVAGQPCVQHQPALADIDSNQWFQRALQDCKFLLHPHFMADSLAESFQSAINLR